MSSGNYYFDSITAQGGFTLEIDLTSGNPVDIYVVGDANFAQHNTLMVKGAGTGGTFVPIRPSAGVGRAHLLGDPRAFRHVRRYRCGS